MARIYFTSIIEVELHDQATQKIQDQLESEISICLADISAQLSRTDVGKHVADMDAWIDSIDAQEENNDE